MNLSEWAKTIPREGFEPVDVCTSLLREKRTFYALLHQCEDEAPGRGGSRSPTRETRRWQ